MFNLAALPAMMRFESQPLRVVAEEVCMSPCQRNRSVTSGSRRATRSPGEGIPSVFATASTNEVCRRAQWVAAHGSREHEIVSDMYSRRLGPVQIAVATACLFLAAPGVAAADEPYVPPQLSFAVSAHAVTATIHNPNDAGICWATVSNGFGPPDLRTEWIEQFGNHTDAGYARPSNTKSITLAGLEPGPHRVGGGCGITDTDIDQVLAPDNEVIVPDGIPPFVWDLNFDLPPTGSA